MAFIKDLQNQFINYLLQVLDKTQEPNTTLNETFKSFIHSLEDYAIFADKSSQKKSAIALLKELSKNTDKLYMKHNLYFTAFNILVKLKIFQQDEPLWLRKFDINWKDYPQYALKSLESPKSQDSIKDYRNYLTVTVDGQDTQDFDDALSLKVHKDTFEVIVHIANVNTSVPHLSALDKDAQAKCRTLYFPYKTNEMLPPDLVYQSMSLVKGKKRFVVSYSFIFNENLDLIQSSIHQGLICVDQNYTYQQVDKILEDQSHKDYHLFQFFLKIAQKRSKLRVEENRGIEFLFKKVDAKIDPKNKIYLKIFDPQKLSIFIIKELMLLTNSKTAEFFNQNQIPCLYINQTISENLPPLKTRYITLKMDVQKIKVHIHRAYLDVENVGHQALGLPFYTQISSPIRRYLDLALQRQLIYFLDTKKILYSNEDLIAIKNTMENLKQNYSNAEMEANKYYLLKYLSENYYNQSLTGTVVKILNSKECLVELSETLVVSKISYTDSLKEGDEVLFLLTTIIPRINLSLGKLVKIL